MPPIHVEPLSIFHQFGALDVGGELGSNPLVKSKVMLSVKIVNLRAR
ncbi:hypothetical protein [Vibrio gallicus]|nr:hypothetical protein [Vibrio gallicus]